MEIIVLVRMQQNYVTPCTHDFIYLKKKIHQIPKPA